MGEQVGVPVEEGAVDGRCAGSSGDAELAAAAAGIVDGLDDALPARLEPSHVQRPGPVHWDDLLRLAGSLKFGHATASLLVGKLSASTRQNTLAAALKEYGALRRTIYAARYLSDPAYRRKISRQLNKGESLHALKRDLLYAHEGTIRARHLEQQTEQTWCLTLVANAVVTWTTEYYGLAVESLRAAGRRVDDEVLAHISPAHSENINFFGSIDVDIDAELAQLGPTGYRPLRVSDTLF
jgi:Tn3 transposase DDE domain